MLNALGTAVFAAILAAGAYFIATNIRFGKPQEDSDASQTRTDQ